MHKSSDEASSHSMSKLKSIIALLNPSMSISIQKCHPHTRNLYSETSGDSKHAFLHCGDVLNVGKVPSYM